MTGTDFLNKARQNRIRAIEFTQDSPRSIRRVRQHNVVSLLGANRRFQNEDAFFCAYDSLKSVA